jgi:hypothetical protein
MENDDISNLRGELESVLQGIEDDRSGFEAEIHSFRMD